MASPQLENGYTKIANEVLEAFLIHKFTEYQRVIFLHIIRKTYGFGKKEDWIANSQFVEATGIPKGHVSRTVRQLENLQVVTRRGNYLSINKDWERWKVTCRGNSSYLQRQQKLPVQELQKKKESITKEITHVAKATEKLSPKKKHMDYVEVDEDGNPIQRKKKQTTTQGELLQVFSLFENPAKESWGLWPKERDAAKVLFKAWGIEELRNRYQVYLKHKDEEFCPQINKPSDFLDKMPQMETFLKNL